MNKYDDADDQRVEDNKPKRADYQSEGEWGKATFEYWRSHILTAVPYPSDGIGDHLAETLDALSEGMMDALYNMANGAEPGSSEGIWRRLGVMSAAVELTRKAKLKEQVNG